MEENVEEKKKAEQNGTSEVKYLSNITVHMKYAKYLPEKNRRETWEELVD